MPFYNASQAAKYIGVSDKTIRRWLAQGKITATKTKTGQLAITASEVERLRQEVEQERTLFITPGRIPTNLDSTGHEQSANTESVIQQISELQAIVTEQEQRIASLERHLQSIAVDAKNRPVLAETTQLY